LPGASRTAKPQLRLKRLSELARAAGTGIVVRLRRSEIPDRPAEINIGA
jgi:hypothetical protein